tara:strand:- start:1233 stop:3680 length:2448 start_codon:yes stop_codon:yes gene_type:complete
MATFNTAFGSLPGYKEMMGTTNSTAGGEEKQPTVYGGQAQAQRTTQQPAQTFAKMQEQGLARPAAPPRPTATPFATYGGSEQGQELRTQLQQRLTEFGQAPSRYDTESFKQIRGAQAANLQSEYSAQQKALNEDLARRGLSASSIGGGRMGDLAGQQARALSSLDAQLLQQAADTQAQDRAQLMQSGQGLAELAGSQDLAQFEANRAAQAGTFENQLRSAQFGQQQFEQAGQEAFQSAQAEESASQAARQFDLAALGQTGGLSLDLQRLLGSQEVERAGLTGQLGDGATGTKTLAGQQQTFQQRQLLFQQAQQMSQQSGVQYTVDDQNNVVPLRDTQGNIIRTSDFTQSAEAQKLQEEELTLRRQLGLMEATGQGLTVDASGRLVQGTAQTLQSRQIATQERQLAFQNAERLSQQSGIQYTVDTTGNVIPLRDAAGNPVKTSADTRAAEALKLQEAGVTGLYGTGAAQVLTQDALQNAYARAAQLSQITGQQYDVNAQTGAITPKSGAGGAATGTLAAELQKAGLTGTLGGTATLDRLQQNLQNAQIMSQITGKQYTVDANGALVVAGDKGTQTETARQADLDMQLRRQLGLTEASGYVYDVNAQGGLTRGTQETVQGQMARSDLLLRLSSALSGLTAEQVAALLGKGTTTPGGNTTTQGGGGNPTTTTRDTGVTTTTTQDERTRQPTTTTGSNTTTTTGSNTTTTGSNTTTTTGSNTTTTPRTTTEQLAPSWATPSFGATFEGQYAPNGNVGGSGYLVSRGGKWYVASTPPSVGSVATPAGGTISNVYPGYTIYESGQRLVWNGASWVSGTNAF